jgi:lactam utilization protein B
MREAHDAVLLLQEPLGGGANRILGATDLDDRDAVQIGLHPAQGDRAAHGRRQGCTARTGRE